MIPPSASVAPKTVVRTCTSPCATGLERSDSAFSFRLLKQLVTLEQVVAVYQLGELLRRSGDFLHGPCPLHRGDNKTAFRAHLPRGLWHCFTSCGGGDVVELVRRIECCDYAEAARKLRSIAGTAPPKPEPACCRSIRPAAPATFRPFRHRIPLDPFSSFLQKSKGILPSTAERFEAGCTDASGFLTGTVAVRLHDLGGLPLGYCGRNLNEQVIDKHGKWRFPPRLPKANVLFNAHRAAAFRTKGTVLVECPWAVMRLNQAGIPSAVALLGTQLHHAHLAWLPTASPILLMLDGDDAGRTAANKIQQRLTAGGRNVAISNLPDGLEPEDLTDRQLAARVRQFLPFS